MKKEYHRPVLYDVVISALIDTVATSDGEKLPVVTDNSDFGGFHPLG